MNYEKEKFAVVLNIKYLLGVFSFIVQGKDRFNKNCKLKRKVIRTKEVFFLLCLAAIMQVITGTNLPQTSSSAVPAALSPAVSDSPHLSHSHWMTDSQSGYGRAPSASTAPVNPIHKNVVNILQVADWMLFMHSGIISNAVP